jgi:GNAT superfamily N-acetyltransferase
MQLQANSAALAVSVKPVHSVRLVTEADIPELVALARDVHAEGGLMPFSERRAHDMARKAVLQDRALGACIGSVGAIEAVLFLLVGQYYYTDYPHLEECFLYVRPEYRRSDRAKYLIQYAKKAAAALHVPLLIGVLSQQRTQAKIRLYERQLGKPAGAYFLWNGKTGS